MATKYEDIIKNKEANEKAINIEIDKLHKQVETLQRDNIQKKDIASRAEAELADILRKHDDEIKCGYTMFTDTNYKFGLISLVEVYGKCKSGEAKICDMIADIINKMHKIDDRIAFKLLLTVMISMKIT